MSEEDYEVDNNGKKLIHRYRLSLENLSKKKPKTKKSNRSPSPDGSSKKKRKTEANQSRSLERSNVLPTTQCPVCDKTITLKGLERHRREKHTDDPNTFQCNIQVSSGKICPFTAKRETVLLDHQRRKHFEPKKIGRPKKNEQPRRSRSPFLVRIFEDRHASTAKTHQMNVQLEKALQSNAELLTEMGRNLQETQNEQMKNAQRLKALEEIKRQKEIEFRKVKTRIAMIESKQRLEDLPDLKDINSLLHYFNLDENCTKEEVRKVVNLRLMESSPESIVSQDIFSNMTKEKREERTVFHNQASEVLLKWIKFRQNE